MTILCRVHPEESEIARKLWPVRARRLAAEDGWVFVFRAGVYVMGWTEFLAGGETLVEYIEIHVEAGTNPELYDTAWAFYVWLKLQGLVRLRPTPTLYAPNFTDISDFT
jgi:hypothetical protein